MMIGWATPTVEPFFGTNDGGPNGAVPVNGVGFCPSAGRRRATGSAGSGNGAAPAGRRRRRNGRRRRGRVGWCRDVRITGRRVRIRRAVPRCPAPAERPIRLRSEPRTDSPRPARHMHPSCRVLDPVSHSAGASYLFHGWQGADQRPEYTPVNCRAMNRVSLVQQRPYICQSWAPSFWV